VVSERRCGSSAALVTEVDSGVVAPAAKTVATLLEEWLEHIEHLGRSPTTLYGYRRLMAQLPDGFKALPLKKVTPKVVDDLYRFLAQPVNRKPATVLRFHTVLRAAFARAVRWSWMDRNPIDRATPPRVNRDEVDPPNVEDVLRILQRALNSRNPENALVFRLLAATGCRRGEVCALQWHDIKLDTQPVRMVIRRAVIQVEKRLIQGTKTHAIRKVSLDEETSQLLREHRDRVVELASSAGVPVQPTDFVFERAPGTGEPLPPSRISQAWQRLCKELGVKARLHDLRTSRRRSSSMPARRSPRWPPASATVTPPPPSRSTAISCRARTHAPLASSAQHSAGTSRQLMARPVGGFPKDSSSILCKHQWFFKDRNVRING